MLNYKVVQVYLPVRLNRAYSYKVPNNIVVKKGNIVEVPFGKRTLLGIVFSFTETLNIDESKLKDINKVEDIIPSIPEELIDFLKWASKYYIADLGILLKMSINTNALNFLAASEEVLSVDENNTNYKETKKRTEIVDYLKDNGPTLKAEIIKSGYSKTALSYLISEGVLTVEKTINAKKLQDNISYSPVQLNESQKEICENIYQEYIENSCFQTISINGVPGSGKTEVYFDLVNKVINKGKQVLILIPEIGLVTQIAKRFKERFNVDPFIWHSDTSSAKKRDAWLASRDGSLKVLIGTRSSLFLPFTKLGLIIVDEEHDPSYKQEEGIRYNARDLAIVRAKLNDIPVVLASASLSLETFNNSLEGKYKEYRLDNRYNNMSLPKISVIDMVNQRKIGCLSQELIDEIQTNIKQGSQTLLFVNKRGYAGSLFCVSCKQSQMCSNCSISLSYHKSREMLVCHYCGYKTKMIENCLECQATKENIKVLGTGIEKVEEDVKNLFPNQPYLLASSDTLTSTEKIVQMQNSILNNEVSIIIGTQILSKGYHFPNITLVGIVDADFHSELDLKASNNLWQTLYQVAGRAGRENKEGKVLLQTYNKEAKIISSIASYNYESFMKEELENRKILSLPPYSQMALIICSSKNLDRLKQYIHEIKQSIPKGDEFSIMGPTEAPIFKLRTNYRYMFLAKAQKNSKLQVIIYNWLKNYINNSHGVLINIDIDPISMY